MPWGFLKKDDARSVPAIGAFGKIPKMGDFVRAGVKLPAGLEAWIQEGMAWGEKKHGAQWAPAYDAGAVHAFAFRSPPAAREEQVVIGVIKPSRDSVGRKHPLVLFVQVAEKQLAGYPHLLPLLLREFIDGACSAMGRAEEAASAEAVKELVASVPLPSFEWDAWERDYAHWIVSAPLHAAWRNGYGDPLSGAPLSALLTIREALAPFQRKENLTTPLSVRLPLGGEIGLEAAFWLDVVRRIAGWRVTVPSFFWSADAWQETRRHVRPAAAILVQLGTSPPPSSLSELWLRDAGSDHVCDLTDPRAQRDKLLVRFPRHLAEKLDQPKTTVGDFLKAL